MTGQSSLARSPSPGLANSEFTLLEASSWSRNLAGPVELVHALSESAIHSGLRFGVSAQSHPQRLPAKLEFNPCLFRARFQLRSCSDSAWLTVLNESLNLSRPTNFLTQDSSHFRSSMDRVPATRLECVLGELLHQQNRSWKRRELQRRSRVLRVRLSEDEYQLLKSFAESHGTTMSGMFRYFIRAIRQLDEQSRTTTEARAAVTEP